MQSDEPVALSYEAPTRRGASPWALIGFSLAVLSLSVPAMIGWMIYQNVRNGGQTIVAVKGFYYPIPAAAVLLCIMGFRGRPRFFAISGIAMALLAMGATLLASSRAW